MTDDEGPADDTPILPEKLPARLPGMLGAAEWKPVLGMWAGLCSPDAETAALPRLALLNHE